MTALLGAPKVKAIRGFSDFGFSYVYVIFEDGTDLYWARTRVLEYLSKITARLPDGRADRARPRRHQRGLGLPVRARGSTPARTRRDELRSYQDWFLRYAVQGVPGVAEVATVGGQVRQYQVTVNPNPLAAYKLPLGAVVDAVRHGNNDVGGRLVEISGTRVHGPRARVRQAASTTSRSWCCATGGGTPVRVKDVATVALGPEMRRGIDRPRRPGRRRRRHRGHARRARTRSASSVA